MVYIAKKIKNEDKVAMEKRRILTRSCDVLKNKFRDKVVGSDSTII